MVNVIEPIFERDFAEQSYGFRPGRGCKARPAPGRMSCSTGRGYDHVVDADLKGYFDHDSSRPLDGSPDRTKITDGSVLSLIEKFHEGLEHSRRPRQELDPRDLAQPQGAVLTCRCLSNIYQRSSSTI